jgi:hypothetical protein
VLVVAEEPGEEYNHSGLETFSVPGFEGMPQDGLVYGKSIEDFVGGFVGVKRTVDETDRKRALEELESQLRDELFAAAFTGADKPAGYHLSKEAVFYEFTTLPDELEETDKVTLTLSGKLHGVLFEEDALARRLAGLTISSYAGETIRIDNPEDLIITLTPVDEEEIEGVPAWEATSFVANVEGKTRFIWEYDEEKLRRDLSGKDTEVVGADHPDSVLATYPGIDRAQATIRPFWKQHFPDAPNDIVVITELDG